MRRLPDNNRPIRNSGSGALLVQGSVGEFRLGGITVMNLI
jgi:hypothetical protein